MFIESSVEEIKIPHPHRVRDLLRYSLSEIDSQNQTSCVLVYGLFFQPFFERKHEIISFRLQNRLTKPNFCLCRVYLFVF